MLPVHHLPPPGRVHGPLRQEIPLHLQLADLLVQPGDQGGVALGLLVLTVAEHTGGTPGQDLLPGLNLARVEWNFQTDDAVSGYVFGYLKYGPSEDTIAMADGHFKIEFWSIQPDSKERLLVGIYHDATLATEADHVTLSEEFTRRGVLERRINETLLAVPRSGLSVIKEELERTIPTAYNFKCPAAQVEVLDVPRSLPSQFGAKRLGLRFTNPTFVPLGTLTELTVSKRRQAPSAGHSFPQWQDGYYREVGASLRYIEGLHSQLAARFGLWLQQNGFHEVIWEKSRVDIEFLSADLLFRAEVKICYKVGSTKAIREALGQLLSTITTATMNLPTAG